MVVTTLPEVERTASVTLSPAAVMRLAFSSATDLSWLATLEAEVSTDLTISALDERTVSVTS